MWLHFTYSTQCNAFVIPVSILVYLDIYLVMFVLVSVNRPLLTPCTFPQTCSTALIIASISYKKTIHYQLHCKCHKPLSAYPLYGYSYILSHQFAKHAIIAFLTCARTTEQFGWFQLKKQHLHTFSISKVVMCKSQKAECTYMYTYNVS